MAERLRTSGDRTQIMTVNRPPVLVIESVYSLSQKDEVLSGIGLWA